MRHVMAILLAVLVALPGCSVRSLSVNGMPVFTRTSQAKGTPRGYAEKIAVGSAVRLELSDGRHLKGTFMGLEGDAIVLEVKARVPEPPITIPLVDVEWLELDIGGTSIAKKVLVAGVVVVGAAFSSLMVYCALGGCDR